MRIAVFTLVLFLTCSAFAAEISGKWNATFSSPDGQSMELVFDFQVDGDVLSGTVTSPMGEMAISEGKVDGDTISFKIEAGGFSIAHTGTVSGDEMTLKSEMGEMVAKRSGS